MKIQYTPSQQYFRDNRTPMAEETIIYHLLGKLDTEKKLLMDLCNFVSKALDKSTFSVEELKEAIEGTLKDIKLDYDEQ
jgi:RNase adaptor protein for sRNA GlmZ degradation